MDCKVTGFTIMMVDGKPTVGSQTLQADVNSSILSCLSDLERQLQLKKPGQGVGVVMLMIEPIQPPE